MNERQYDVTGALADLRAAVAGAVAPPAATTLRARAEQRLRRRRLSAVVVAAAVVIAVALGVTTVVRTTANPPLPPAGTSTPPPTTTAPTPTPGRPAPRPDRPVPTYPVTTVDDPIARVDWVNVTLPVPPRADCPAGRLRFRDGVTSAYPRMFLYVEEAAPAYGDLTGDGRFEAVIATGCRRSPAADHSADQLLVVGRGPSGELRAVGWVGPVDWGIGAAYWIDRGRLVIDPSTDVDTQASMGQTMEYRWRDGRFQALAGRPGIQPASADRPGAPIDLGPSDGYVARALGCPGGPVRITEPVWGSEATADAAIYSFSTAPGQRHLYDLSGDGRRHLLLAVACLDPRTYRPANRQQPEDVLGEGVLVLDRTADNGFRAVDIVPTPAGLEVESWDFDRGRLSIRYDRVAGGGEVPPQVWVWNGDYFQRDR
jgi:hypothetical protein